MSEYNNSRRQVRLPIFLSVAAIIGVLIGSQLSSPKSIISGSSATSKFSEILKNVESYYVDSINSEDLVEGAIANMLKELDPHTSYIPAAEKERLNSQLRGSYDGIGIQFDILRDTIFVIRPLPGGPSEKLGLMPGDKIIAVEEEIMAGIGVRNRDVTDRLLGPRGSEVKITLLKHQQIDPIELTIARGSIPQSTVEVSYMVDAEIGFVKITRFGAKTHEEFLAAVRSLKEQGMSKLILDLRGNTGGFMGAAQNIADELIDGSPIIVSQKSEKTRFNSTYRAKFKGVFEEQPIIVLVDEYSASASEIVAGALQDNDRALIVGRRSFGKGLVQLPINLSDGSELRLTIARYYTPSGRSIQKPYENGEDYGGDIMARYNHGEFFNADSIKFQDSLKFETASGRPVYGGGGIMPDVFVPYDTTGYTNYYQRLLSSRALREYTLYYYLNHQLEMDAMEFDEFINDFEIDQPMMNRAIEIGKELKIEFNSVEFLISKPILEAYIKAEIGRFVWGNEGFYPVFNLGTDELFKKSITLFGEAERLAMN